VHRTMQIILNPRAEPLAPFQAVAELQGFDGLRELQRNPMICY
jgi:hypothetical protein